MDIQFNKAFNRYVPFLSSEHLRKLAEQGKQKAKGAEKL